MSEWRAVVNEQTRTHANLPIISSSFEMAVSTVAIETKARLLAHGMKIEDFNGRSYNWVYKVMRQNNLSIRAWTSVGQRLLEDWETKLEDFRTFVHKEITDHSLPPNDVINMDEVPMVFDIPPTRSVAEVGVKTKSYCNNWPRKNLVHSYPSLHS